MSTPVSEDNKRIAELAARAFGGDYQVREYLHDTEPLAVDILRCEDRPRVGVTSYSTIGLSDNPARSGERKLPTWREIAGVCATVVQFFPNVLASAAFHVMRTGEAYRPGVVMANYVRQYDESTPLPHLYFTEPFPWGDALKSLKCPTKTVSWLMAVPISESQYSYVKRHGDSSLEKLLRSSQIDIFDMNRSSVV